MNILLSNDDGVSALGLQVLYDTLSQNPMIKAITVVAPDRNRSAASNSLTLESPLRVKILANGFYAVNGTPTDCVHLGITGLLKEEPDMVISGINAGANLGDDVIYSGTVAAAMEGRFLGLPAIAVSSIGEDFYQTAADAVNLLLDDLPSVLKSSNVLNVNVPNLPMSKIKGFTVTRLGARHKAKPIIKQKDPRGVDAYWVGSAGEEQDAGEGTDFYAISQNEISITPIHTDLTCHSDVETLRKKLKINVN